MFSQCLHFSFLFFFWLLMAYVLSIVQFFFVNFSSHLPCIGLWQFALKQFKRMCIFKWSCTLPQSYDYWVVCPWWRVLSHSWYKSGQDIEDKLYATFYLHVLFESFTHEDNMCFCHYELFSLYCELFSLSLWIVKFVVMNCLDCHSELFTLMLWLVQFVTVNCLFDNCELFSSALWII